MADTMKNFYDYFKLDVVRGDITTAHGLKNREARREVRRLYVPKYIQEYPGFWKTTEAVDKRVYPLNG